MPRQQIELLRDLRGAQQRVARNRHRHCQQSVLECQPRRVRESGKVERPQSRAPLGARHGGDLGVRGSARLVRRPPSRILNGRAQLRSRDDAAADVVVGRRRRPENGATRRVGRAAVVSGRCAARAPRSVAGGLRVRRLRVRCANHRLRLSHHNSWRDRRRPLRDCA